MDYIAIMKLLIHNKLVCPILLLGIGLSYKDFFFSRFLVDVDFAIQFLVHGINDLILFDSILIKFIQTRRLL